MKPETRREPAGTKTKNGKKMKTNQIAASLQDKVLTLGPAQEQFRLADLVRKTYQVIVTDIATGETHTAGCFDNSADANACANLQGGEVVVDTVTATPKKAFWNLYADYKSEINAQGVYVTKVGGEYQLSDRKATRREIIAGNDYGPSAGTINREDRFSYFAGNVKFAY